jgi:hypothetical protein
MFGQLPCAGNNHLLEPARVKYDFHLRIRIIATRVAHLFEESFSDDDAVFNILGVVSTHVCRNAFRQREAEKIKVQLIIFSNNKWKLLFLCCIEIAPQLCSGASRSTGRNGFSA